MLVSHHWLRDYVPQLDVPLAQLEERLMMAGLNHDGTELIDGDAVLNLEVTSNRADCLGHLGIAREAAVLFRVPLEIPAATPPAQGEPASALATVRIECPELCPRYIARVIRGVRVGPSPAWLMARLKALGIAAINNVVDVTNYVLMECGQPLHAFDLHKLAGREIVVRRARSGEQLEAINHKSYPLDTSVCVIADAERPVALGGVMGGAESEVTPQTVDLLIEAAAFDPANIRATARKLNLHSDSSYRFERGVDVANLDWASRRACELILQLAGGTLAAEAIDVGTLPPERKPIALRYAQLERVLGISVPADEVRRILTALGNRELSADADSVTCVPPSWRADLSREIDLVEEVARIHGYDKIPEDVGVPMTPSARSHDDRVLERVRQVLVAVGFDEAMTASIVEESWSTAFSPWTDEAPLMSNMPLLRGANCLRRSLVPSLLGVRRTNESLANAVIELFEIARVYWPDPHGKLPHEPLMLCATSSGDFLALKGIIEAILATLRVSGRLELLDAKLPISEAGQACELRLDGERIGYLGQVSREGLRQFDLRRPATYVELHLQPLLARCQLVPLYREPSVFPVIERDLNLVVPESVRWADIEATVCSTAGQVLEAIGYQDTYRDAEKLGPGKKSLLFTLRLRSASGTLTGSEADALREQIVAACGSAHGAQLRE